VPQITTMPTNLTSKDITTTSFSVEWDNRENSIVYTATATSASNSNTNVISGDISGNRAFFTNLIPGTTYNVIIKAGNIESRPLSITTIEIESAPTVTNTKDIIIFGTPLHLEDPRKTDSDTFTESQIEALKLFGLDGDAVKDNEKRKILIALYDGKCNTEKPLIFLEKCEPIRTIVQRLALQLLGNIQSGNTNVLNNIQKEEQPIVEFNKLSDGSMKVSVTFKPGQLSILSKITKKKISKKGINSNTQIIAKEGEGAGAASKIGETEGEELETIPSEANATEETKDNEIGVGDLFPPITNKNFVNSTDIQTIDEDKFKKMGLIEQKELLEAAWEKADKSRYKNKYDRLKAIIDEEEETIQSAINVKYRKDIDRAIKSISKTVESNRTDDDNKIMTLYGEIDTLKQSIRNDMSNNEKSNIEINVNKKMDELVELVKNKIKSLAISTGLEEESKEGSDEEAEVGDLHSIFPAAKNENFVNSSNIQSLTTEKLDAMGLLEARMALENAWKKADQSAFIATYNNLKRHLDTMESELEGADLYSKELGISSNSGFETITSKFIELAPKLNSDDNLSKKLKIAHNSLLKSKLNMLDTTTTELQQKLETLYDKSYGNKEFNLAGIEQMAKNNKLSQNTKSAYKAFIDIYQVLPDKLIALKDAAPNAKQVKINELNTDITKAKEALELLISKKSINNKVSPLGSTALAAINEDAKGKGEGEGEGEGEGMNNKPPAPINQRVQMLKGSVKGQKSISNNSILSRNPLLNITRKGSVIQNKVKKGMQITQNEQNIIDKLRQLNENSEREYNSMRQKMLTLKQLHKTIINGEKLNPSPGSVPDKILQKSKKIKLQLMKDLGITNEKEIDSIVKTIKENVSTGGKYNKRFHKTQKNKKTKTK